MRDICVKDLCIKQEPDEIQSMRAKLATLLVVIGKSEASTNALVALKLSKNCPGTENP